MALSDPVNVRLGAERRKKTLMKLAQQMASRAGGRAQGAGAAFRSNVQGRGSALPTLRLPFPMPQGRARPAGFDPGMGQPPVFQSGPPSMGGGMGLGGAIPLGPDPLVQAPMASQTAPPLNAAGYPENTSYADLGVMPSPITGPDQPGWISGPNSMPQMGAVTQSDSPLNQPMASQMAYPDPWQVMLSRMPYLLSGGQYRAT